MMYPFLRQEGPADLPFHQKKVFNNISQPVGAGMTRALDRPISSPNETASFPARMVFLPQERPDIPIGASMVTKPTFSSHGVKLVMAELAYFLHVFNFTGLQLESQGGK